MKFIKSEYFSILFGGLISIVGLYFYDWKIINVVFFIYLNHLFKSPFIVLTYFYATGKQVNKTMPFVAIFSVVFAFFSLFFMFLVHSFRSGYGSASVQQTFYDQMSEVTSSYGWAIWSIFLFAALRFYLNRKDIPQTEKKASRYSMKIGVYYGLMFFVPLTAAVMQSKEFDLSHDQTSISTIILFVGSDLLYTRFSQKKSEKK